MKRLAGPLLALAGFLPSLLFWAQAERRIALDSAGAGAAVTSR